MTEITSIGQREGFDIFLEIGVGVWQRLRKVCRLAALYVGSESECGVNPARFIVSVKLAQCILHRALGPMPAGFSSSYTRSHSLSVETVHF